MPRPGRKRLTVDIPIFMHEQLNEISKKSNLKMSDLVKRLLQQFINAMQYD